jgi:thiamine-monophosphate kinase
VSEFDLIERIARRAGSAPSVLLGIGDDAAVLQPTPGKALVATTDSLVLDRHFTVAWSPSDIGHLALAVNLSDLAAMAATPRWVLLSLTLPESDPVWLDGFLDGFLALAERFDTVLVGGNISSGPLNIGVQLLGEVDPDRMVDRNGARPGDLLAVTGSLGDPAAALLLGEAAKPTLRARLHRPEPRLAAGQALAAHVHAMIDISDGLLADLAHLLKDRLGAELDLASLPASPALTEALDSDLERWRLQAGGGNDYELLLALPPEVFDQARAKCATLGLELTAIGRVSDRPELVCRDSAGRNIELPARGWDHFESS